MWNWSFRAFRLFGTDVRVHWSLPAFILFYVMRGQQAGYTPVTLLFWVIVPMLLLFASVVCHEFGHVFAARRFGHHTGNMILTPIGGMVMVGQGRSPLEEGVVAAAGPAVNAALVVLGLGVYALTGSPFSSDLVLPIGDDALLGSLWVREAYFSFTVADFIETNAVLFLFNVLLIAYPLDGGRMLLSVLWRRLGYRRGVTVACRVAQGLAIVIGVVAIALARMMLGVIAFFVFMQATTTLRQVPLLADPSVGYGRAGRKWADKRQPVAAAPHKSNGSNGHAASARSIGTTRSKNPITRWLERRQAQRAKALLARAEAHGVNTLTESERAFLKKMRRGR